MSNSPASPSPGDQYAIGRWTELAATDAVWFGRTADVGHRLRLRELITLAEANQSGGVRAESIGNLLKETVAALKDQDLYVSERFPEIAGQADSMMGSLAAFVPGSAGHCTAVASLERLNDVRYVDGLVETLASKAAGAGQSIDALRKVDKLVELLDSELAHRGHSRSWRAEAVAQTKRLMQDGATLGQALPSALEELRACRSREFEIFIPIDCGLAELPGWVQSRDSVGEIIKSWASVGRPEAQAAIQASAGVYGEAFPAVDAEAALRIADDRFRRLRNVWRLQDHELPYPRHAVVYDPAARQAAIRPLPSEPLDLAPDGLGERDARKGGDALDDAIDQLAQARTARPAAAFVDLWTAVETLYGGSAEDTRYKAGMAMVGMAEYNFIVDSHIWLARRAGEAGMGGAPKGGELNWLMEMLGSGDGAQELERAFIAAGDQLAWLRFKVMSNWDNGWGLRNELGLLRQRLTRVVERSYLIRNFAVHRADDSMPSLDLILPLFAGLVKTCIGLSLHRSNRNRLPLTEAKLAAMTVGGVAEDFGRGRSKAPKGLASVL